MRPGENSSAWQLRERQCIEIRSLETRFVFIFSMDVRNLFLPATEHHYRLVMLAENLHYSRLFCLCLVRPLLLLHPHYAELHQYYLLDSFV